MPPLPEPTPITLPAPTPPVGRWPARTARALLIHHRLPTSLARTLEHLAVRAGLRHRRLLIPDPEGGLQPARFRLRRRSSDVFYVEEVFIKAAYSPPGYEICERDAIIDVGANMGAFAIFAARRARRGRVLAFEPTGENFALLQRNIRGNRLENIHPHRAAVTGQPGPVSIHLSPTGTGQHSLDPSLAGPSSRSETIPGETLAEVFDREEISACDFLKLDCEGAEFGILESLSRPMARRVRRLAVEFHTTASAPKRAQSDALASLLVDLGFQIDIYTDVLETNRGMIFARR